jgi:hypothetical protein
MRTEPVVDFSSIVEPGELRRVIDKLTATFGRVTSLTDMTLMYSLAGEIVKDPPVDPGTALPATRHSVDFADAGIDSVRIIIYASTEAGIDVVVQIYDVTNSTELAALSVGAIPAALRIGPWTTIADKDTGADQVIEVRLIGDGATDVTLHRVHLQGRSVQKRV